MHLLQQKIQFLAEFSGAVEKLCKLLQVATQAIEFFADVAALCKQRGFLGQTSRLDACTIQEFFEAGLESPREGRRQRFGQIADLIGLLADACHSRA